MLQPPATLAVAGNVGRYRGGGDATLLQVLLRNLVENAHRYSPAGTTITVSLSAAQRRFWRWKMKDQALMRRKAAN
jgi:signal transduction histidine kinase